MVLRLCRGEQLGNHEISHDLTQPLALDQLALLRLEVLSDLRIGAGRHLNLARHLGGLHPARSVDRLASKGVSKLAVPDHAGDDSTHLPKMGYYHS